MARKIVRRDIYDNYILWDLYADDAKAYLEEEFDNDDPSDDEIWDEIYHMDQVNWEDELESLKQFFDDGSLWILVGSVERWDGIRDGGFLFHTFAEMWNKATVDCDYFHLYDENGHFYLTCSHHDGTNTFEIKRVTQSGQKYWKNWNESWDDKRSDRYIYSQIMERYSTLPHYLHAVYGCPKVQYENTKVAV